MFALANTNSHHRSSPRADRLTFPKFWNSEFEESRHAAILQIFIGCSKPIETSLKSWPAKVLGSSISSRDKLLQSLVVAFWHFGVRYSKGLRTYPTNKNISETKTNIKTNSHILLLPSSFVAENHMFHHQSIRGLCKASEFLSRFSRCKTRLPTPRPLSCNSTSKKAGLGGSKKSRISRNEYSKWCWFKMIKLMLVMMRMMIVAFVHVVSPWKSMDCLHHKIPTKVSLRSMAGWSHQDTAWHPASLWPGWVIERRNQKCKISDVRNVCWHILQHQEPSTLTTMKSHESLTSALCKDRFVASRSDWYILQL